jgi:hypothetical protein
MMTLAADTWMDKFGDWYVPEPNTGCWLWMRALSLEYGTVAIHGKHMGAHRAAYLAMKGPIPAGLHIDHLCRQPTCVNPDHLEAVTPRENNMRSRSVSAAHARKTHCNRGHEFNETNTRRYADGARHCVICDKARGLARYYRMKANK